MVVNFLLVSIGAVFGVLARVLSTNWIKKRMETCVSVGYFYNK
ncbi:hypothetical protein TMUPMC115_0682 [Tetragenococcus muriaticus PMC-11-5]|uniref:Uncharacterized protein n=1 Tax=Tetragenococcus muriaticus PMC-11-5 TaxID=1302649 RepID=A0A091C7P5_9ENTE|nr:hypothetical protein TMUPMC115_0682 [Tetragenococcus muriaticus PMC-11-5]